MNIAQRDIADAAASKVVLDNLQMFLDDTASSRKLISLSLVPFCGIRWSAKIVRRVASDRIREIPWPIRNSKLDKQIYERIRELWHVACENESDFPAVWGMAIHPGSIQS